jgi:exopolyphosphatase/guanosine-5'-triphosphate,3'-diphosphate pyrophosphatase
VTPPPLSAALDIGSNSVHLLVARRGMAALPEPLVDVSQQIGIGTVVDATGAMGTELRDEVVRAVAGYVAQARDLGVDRVVVLGTEALRRASDAGSLAEALRDRTGLAVFVLDHSSEGLLTLLGVTAGDIAGSLAVVDIGGGSTEVTYARPGSPPVVGVLPVGSARLAASHVEHDPVTEREVEALRAAARALVSDLEMPRPERAIVAGGSGTNVSRLLRRERTTPIDRAAIAEALALLRSQPAATLAERTGLTPRRIAQLAAGLAIGEALFDQLGLDVAEVSDASLREGVLIASWRVGDGWLQALPAIVARTDGAGRKDPAREGSDRAS